MNRNSLKVLAAIVVTLVLIVVFVERTDDAGAPRQGQYLLQNLSDQANLARQVRIVQADGDELTFRRQANQWVAPVRDDYPVDIGKLRPLIVALSEARIIEEKTSNPELYEKLAVDDPENGGSGTRITIDGADFSYAVILGDSASGNRRYARIPDALASFLVDRNPEVPAEIGDWLAPDIIDIDAQRIRKVAIIHEDGEAITIEKSARDLTDFAVLDVPAGRELSYATVGNGIAGGLAKLELDDVRRTPENAPVETSAVFHTWDGLQITATVSNEDDESWVAFSAKHVPAIASTNASNDGGDDQLDGQGEETVSSAPEDEAREINDHLSGWQYRIPAYKKNLFTRRWKDILESTDAEASAD